MKKILVLGSSSFGGAALIDFLLDKNYQVYGTFRRKKNKTYLPYLENKNFKHFKNFKIDFNDSPKKLINLILRLKPDCIIDFAAISVVNQSWEFPDTYFDINVKYKLEIFKRLNKFNFLRKYILISTPEIFGNTTKLLKEKDNNFNPSTPYATSKLSAEFLLKNYGKKANFSFIITRFSNFFGPGQPVYRLIPKIIMCIDKKLKFPLEGGGKTRRNFIFSYDFCNGIYKVIEKGKRNNTYHFAGNKYYKISDIVKIICKLKNYNYKKLIKITKSRKGQDIIYKLDSKKTRRELNWKPIFSIKKALKQAINFSSLKFNKFSNENVIYTDTNFKKK